jgi:hypothetical protein
MKRLLILATAAVLVLGWAAATYAEIDWGASGFVRVRSKWGVNSGNAPRATAGDFDRTEAWMDTRFRLRFAAKANDYATAVIYFEGDSSRWGERETPVYLANHGAVATNSFTRSGARNAAGVWNSDRTAVELKQFYIDFKVPGLSDFAPTNIKAGIQGFSVRSHALLFADGPGVEVNTTAGPVKFNLYWYKPEEGSDWKADDADIYGAQVWLPGLLPVTPGGYLLYLNANNYPLRSSTAVTAPGPPPTTTEKYPAERMQADLFWLGFYVDGKIGPVALKTDFIYSGGDVEARSYGASQFGDTDVDLSGWMFFADVCYSIPMEMAIDVGGTFMYATGNDVGDVDFDGYAVPPGSEEPYIGAWSIVYYASAINDGTRISNLGSGTAAAYGKAGGTWFAKVYGAVKPLDWLKVTAYGMYIGDTTKDGNTVGNAADPTEATGLEDESGIGIELGAIADLQIYKNLSYSIGAGFLFAGDALDTVDGAGVNQSPDDPWAIVSQLIFKF